MTGRRALPLAALVALAASLLTRAWTFGNPVIHIDEQFYLTVGDRLLRGALPYVDIWDIKPIGLFALYAAIAWLWPGSIIAYQIVALVAVVLTAVLLFAMARRVAGVAAALLCCGAYPAWVTIFDGIGGQSEIFLNLPIAAAAALCVARFTGDRARAGLLPGVAVMLWVGVGLQIKYSAVFQGVFLGLFMLAGIADARRRIGHVATCAVVWVVAALAPTALGLALYALGGHGDAFVQANFVAIFTRQGASDAWALLWKQLVILTPFWAATAFLLVRTVRASAPCEQIRFVLCWSGASVAGYLIFGGFHHSYVLPLLPSLCVTAAIATGRLIGDRRPALALAVVVALTGIGAGVGELRVIGKGVSRADAPRIARVTRAVRSNLGDGCLYILSGPPILYYTTHACTVTRFLFPSHLSGGGTARELGIDRLDNEVRRIFARRPRVVVAQAPDPALARFGVPAIERLARQELARHYRMLPALADTGLEVHVRCGDGAAACPSR